MWKKGAFKVGLASVLTLVLRCFVAVTYNRCGYQSITQQYLKKICLIQDDSNYMFRPNVAIIRFSSESMVVVLYRIGMDMSRW